MKKHFSFDVSKKISHVFGHQNFLPKACAVILVGILYLVLLQHFICHLTAASHPDAGCSISVR